MLGPQQPSCCAQVLFTLPELHERYVRPATSIFATAPAEPANDLPTQMAKLGVALVTGRTGAPAPPAAVAEQEGAGGATAAATAPEPMETDAGASLFNTCIGWCTKPLNP